MQLTLCQQQNTDLPIQPKMHRAIPYSLHRDTTKRLMEEAKGKKESLAQAFLTYS
jgi:hypothetical protein